MLDGANKGQLFTENMQSSNRELPAVGIQECQQIGEKDTIQGQRQG